MRSVFALSLSIIWCASADAVTVHRSRPHQAHFRTQPPVVTQPGQRATALTRFAVPGWTDQQTRKWLDNANSGWDSDP
jgi:hypothetical protein